MRTTTIIAPTATAKRFVPRGNPILALGVGSGFVLVAIVCGAVLLVLSPFGWAAQKLGRLIRRKG